MNFFKIQETKGSNVRIRNMKYVFTVIFAMFALMTTGYSQDAAPQGQQDGGGQPQAGGGRGRGGGRGQRATGPSAPTPRRTDGKPWIGSIPGQKPGRWSGGAVTTLPTNILDKFPVQPWADAV